MSPTLSIPDALTLEEVANYLRLPKELVDVQPTKGQIPARRIEDTWQFFTRGH